MATDWRNVKVPASAAAEAERLKDRLRRIGTGRLPLALAPEGELTLGHIFVVGVARMKELIEDAERAGRPGRRK